MEYFSNLANAIEDIMTSKKTRVTMACTSFTRMSPGIIGMVLHNC